MSGWADKPVDFSGFDPGHVEDAAKAAWANYQGLDTLERFLERRCYDEQEERDEAERARVRELAEWPKTGLYPGADDFRRCAIAAMQCLVRLGWGPPRAAEAVVFDAIESFQVSGRGTVLVGPYPFDCSIEEAVGRKIVFGAIEYTVRGVEWNLVRAPQRGDVCGILVK